MSAVAISILVFAVVVVATAFGVFLNRVIPQHHLSKESKEIIQLGIGVIVTLTALVLGLLVASAKGSFDTKSDEIRQSSVKIVLVDSYLRQYGADAKEARDFLRRWVDDHAEAIWTPESRRVPAEQGNAVWTAFHEKLRALAPANDTQRRLHAKLLDLTDEVALTRWLLTEQAGSSIQTPFLLVLVLWLGIIFASFGLFAPRNGTVYAVIVLSALSLSTAVFLVLELDQAFAGTIRISDAPYHVLVREIHR
ncbi:MAG: hypothetical protein ABWZ29_04435 [Casimicrobiaceae bacterium]